MKIGILIDRLNVGGVEKIAIEQVKALRSLKEEAYLLVLRRKGVVNNAFEDLTKDLPIIYLDDRLPKFLRFNFKFPIFSFFSLFHLTYPFFIPFVIKQYEYNYIISHGTYTSFTAIGIKKFRSIPFSAFIWDPIGYILLRVYKNKFPKPLLKIFTSLSLILDRVIVHNSDAILVGGSAHNKFFRRINPLKKIIVIPPSTHFSKHLNANKEKFVLMVTAWKRGKNPEYIKEICEIIPDIKIKMAGKWLDHEYLSEFKGFIRDNKIVKNVEVLGAVSESELVRLYKKTFVLLQTNDDKGFGMPAMEAAGNGTTFIIPQGQGVCELFTQGIEGYFTAERDTITIVKYLKEILNSEDKAKKMGKTAWEKVKTNYSWQKHAEMLKKIAIDYEK